jgi:dimethylargininase
MYKEEVIMVTALTRAVSRSIADCALSYIERQSIDPDLAAQQHRAYEDLLRRLGAEVVVLPPEADLPDAVFVEDTVVAVDELAVLTIPRLPSRQPEVESMAVAIAAYRPVQRLSGDARLEGGDVIRIDRTLYVGLSRRTNRAGIEQLAAFLAPHDYNVQPVEMNGCLHLKTACTYVGNNTVLANRAWVDTAVFGERDVVEVSPAEPDAGNALPIGGALVFPAAFPETRAALEDRGFRVETVDVSELQKAEAGVTCCSVLLNGRRPAPAP